MDTDSLACSLWELSDDQRSRRVELVERFKKAIRKVDELQNGYAVDLDATISADQLEEWTGYEALCCSFLSFEVKPTEHGHRVTIGGPRGAKSFLAQEFIGSS